MIFKGYWNKPEETEEAFHDGYFLTGDVAVMDETVVLHRGPKKGHDQRSGTRSGRRGRGHPYENPQLWSGRRSRPGLVPRETVRPSSPEGRRQCDREELITFCKERMADYNYPRMSNCSTSCPRPRPASSCGAS